MYGPKLCACLCMCVHTVFIFANFTDRKAFAPFISLFYLFTSPSLHQVSSPHLLESNIQLKVRCSELCPLSRAMPCFSQPLVMCD